eukprot:TRINITY_DN16010_c0_g1_i1.p1 TRINITY_DN16010_c0_g1~~TRINITY_DN16010_c0_g1_i1.p1  ORF type:complete len:227 (+),score=45.73 TRINITY_DN16010_c0_g1_i1:90-770(+)
MSKPLSLRLHEAFEAHGALQLPADHFVIILRSLGATVSAKEGRALAKKFRKDAEGHVVDVQKFCAWFTGMEQDPRFAKQEPTSLPLGLEDRDDARLVLDDDVGVQPSDPNLASMHGGEEGHGADQDEANLDDDGAAGFPAEGFGGGEEDPDRPHMARSVSFSRHVSADDQSVWSLGDEDRCTLPSHRRLSEHERLMADFRATLHEVKARLDAGAVTYRNDLRSNPS